MAADCTFCRIVAGDAPAHVVAEDERTIAFLDLAPANEGHTLVAPRTHATDIWAISGDDLVATMRMAKQIAHLLDERLAPDGLNLVQSNRPAGWQEVFHFHVHVIPRWDADTLTPPWQAPPASPDRLRATWSRLSST